MAYIPKALTGAEAAGTEPEETSLIFPLGISLTKDVTPYVTPPSCLWEVLICGFCFC